MKAMAVIKKERKIDATTKHVKPHMSKTIPQTKLKGK